jgi:hypothetical protein
MGGPIDSGRSGSYSASNNQRVSYGGRPERDHQNINGEAADPDPEGQRELAAELAAMKKPKGRVLA